MFSTIERKNGWSFTDSLYFCFVTLFTIGFGDFIPGKDKNNPQTAEEMLIGLGYYWFIIFWIFIGLVDINFITGHLADVIRCRYVKLKTEDETEDSLARKLKHEHEQLEIE